MARQIKKILDSLEEDLTSVSLDESEVTVRIAFDAQNGGVTKSGHFSFKLDDILEVLRLINKIITTVRKLKKKFKK